MDPAEDIKTDQSSSIDAAWEQKRFALVSSLLKNDSEFPDQFNLEELNKKDDVQRSLKVFAMERNLLHEWIKNDQLREVQEYTSKNQSKYFFNVKNKSAAFTALKKRKFEIYAYLQTIGANLTKLEAREMKYLTPMEKQKLRDVMLSYFPRDEKSHIYHLMSKIKIKSQKTFKECREELFGYLEKLNEISSVSIILKVMQYVEHLDVVLDLDKENVKAVCPTATKAEKGVTFSFLGTIYIAAGPERSRNEVLGTMAHEFTHMAMELVFRNNSDPYLESDSESREEFMKIAEYVEENRERFEDVPSKTLGDAFLGCYTEVGDHLSELIARVPHVLAQYDNGEDWLEKKVPQLLQFYKEKVIPKCEELVKKSHLLKFKSLNRDMNENEGEIIEIKKWGLLFKNVDKLKDFFSILNKKIYLLITDYTRLGLIRAMQANYNTGYADSYDKFLVFNVLENVLKNLGDVEYLFNSEATEMLFIECSGSLEDCYNASGGIKRIVEIVKQKNDKKVVFITKEEESETITEIIEECGLSEAFVSEYDEDYSLCELMERSQEKILDSKISFQGTDCTLDELIDGNEDLLKCVNAEKITDILSGKNIEIGSKPFGTSSLEGAYADIVYETDLNALVHEINNSENFFVISGKRISNNKRDLLKSLKEGIASSLVGELKNFDVKILSSKRLFLTDEVITDNDFKTLCSFNSNRKIYHLKKEESNFVLLKLFNPDFYFKRQFKRYKKIVVKKGILDNRVLESMPDIFIIVDDGINHLQNISDFSKVKIVKEDKTESAFNEFGQLETAVHVLKWENDQLIWIKSCGSLSKFRPWINWDKLEEEIVTSENLLVSKVKKDKVVILADDPGMGKSTSITKLYEIEKILSDHWVIRINLKDHIKAIKDLKDNLSVSQIISFLTEIDFKLRDHTIKLFLETAIDLDKKFGKILLLCFDGFDELLDVQDRTKILNLFRFLQISTKCKIWVTTRLHYKITLEDALVVFSVKFEPIDDLSKENFIKNYLENRIKLTINKEKYDEVFASNEEQGGIKLKDYSKRFLAKTNEIFQKDLERFIGTPLQLNLLLENSIPSLRLSIETLDNFDFLYIGKDLVEVYQNFFNRKYEIYCKKENLFEKTSQGVLKDKFEEWHEQLADFLITNKVLKGDFSETKSLILLLGITKEESKSIEFIHFTFREYFYVQSLIKNLIREGDEISTEKIYKFLIEQILVQQKYELMRKFLNAYLEKQEIRKSLQEKMYQAYDKQSKNYYSHFEAVREHNNNILDLLLTLYFSKSVYCKIFNKLSFPNEVFFRSSESLLHFAVKSQNNFAVMKIIELASKYNFDQQLLTDIDNEKYTAFQSALLQKNDFAVNQIFKLASKHNFNQQLITAVDTFGNTAFHIAVRSKNDFALKPIIELASKYNLHQELITSENKSQKTSFHLAIEYRNDWAVNRIIELASNYNLDKQLLTLVHETDMTIFHLAMKYKNDFAVDRIIELASKYNEDRSLLLSVAGRLKVNAFYYAITCKHDYAVDRIIEMYTNYNLDQQLVTSSGNRSDTAFHVAIKNKNDFAVNRIIKLARKFHLDQQLLTANDNYGNEAFHLAAANKNDFAVNRILELSSKYNLDQQLLTSTGHYSNTAFHFAIINKNDFAVNRIIELASKYKLCQLLLTAQDINGSKAFHLAVMNKNDFAVNRILELSSKYNLDQELITAKGLRDDTAFHSAITKKNDFAVSRIIELAIKNNLDQQLPTAVGYNEITAFQLALMKENDFAVSRIIKLASKYNLNHQLLTMGDKYGNTAFHLAIQEKSDLAVNKIIELSSKFNLDEQSLVTSTNEFGNTGFHSAVIAKNDFAVNLIIELASKYNLDRQLLTVNDSNKKTAFHFAIAYKNNFAVNRIIELALKYNLYQQLLTDSDIYGNIAFHLAVENKNDLAVNQIIQLASKYDLEQQLLTAINFRERTAFHIAAENGNDLATSRMIELASKHNLEEQLLNSVEAFGNTAFHLAVENQNEFAVNRIIELASTHNLGKLLTAANTCENTAFHLAMERRNDFAFNRIIELASARNLDQQLLTSVGFSKMTAFQLAVEMKNNLAVSRIIEIVIKKNLNQELLTTWNHFILTAFYAAVRNKNDFAVSEIIELVSKHNLDEQLLTSADAHGNTAFHLAVEIRNDLAFNRIIELAIKHNVDQKLLAAANKNGNTAFHLAVEMKNDFAFNQIIELVSKYHVDQYLLSANYVNGKTIFHLAIQYKNDFALNRIIELAEKNNLDQQLLLFLDKDKETAYFLAVIYKNDLAINQIIGLASKYNLDQNLLTAVDKSESTALHLAARYKNHFAFKQIIELASKYNLERQLLTAVNESGNTAFHLAVKYNNDFAVNRIYELALKYNLDEQLLTASNIPGNLAFHLAVSNKNDFAVDRIIELGSKYNLDQQLILAVNADGHTAFHLAVREKNKFGMNRVIELASKHSLDQKLLTAVDGNKRTAFHFGVQYKFDFAVNRIIELASKNHLDQQLLTGVAGYKYAAFHLAVIKKNDLAVNRIIELASKHNVDQQLLTAYDMYGNKAFNVAVANLNDYAVNQILELSSEYNLDDQLLTSTDSRNNTAFYFAIEKKNDFALNRIIELAIKNNLAQQLLTAVQGNGDTALHSAVTCKNDLAVNRIIELASQCNLGQQVLTYKNKAGITAMHLATTKKYDYALKRMNDLHLN